MERDFGGWSRPAGPWGAAIDPKQRPREESGRAKRTEPGRQGPSRWRKRLRTFPHRSAAGERRRDRTQKEPRRQHRQGKETARSHICQYAILGECPSERTPVTICEAPSLIAHGLAAQQHAGAVSANSGLIASEVKRPKGPRKSRSPATEGCEAATRGYRVVVYAERLRQLDAHPSWRHQPHESLLALAVRVMPPQESRVVSVRGATGPDGTPRPS